jgi:hypothetical protein
MTVTEVRSLVCHVGKWGGMNGGNWSGHVMGQGRLAIRLYKYAAYFSLGAFGRKSC